MPWEKVEQVLATDESLRLHHDRWPQGISKFMFVYTYKCKQHKKEHRVLIIMVASTRHGHAELLIVDAVHSTCFKLADAIKQIRRFTTPRITTLNEMYARSGGDIKQTDMYVLMHALSLVSVGHLFRATVEKDEML